MAPTGGFNFKIWPSLAIIMALAHRSESAGHETTDQRKITRKWQDVGTRFAEVNSAQFVLRWTRGSFIPYTDLSLTEINISAGNVLEDTVKLFLCQNTERSQRNVTSSEWRRTWNFTPTSTDTGSLVSNNQGHHYCSLKPLDATNLENGYPTAHMPFSAKFGKERFNDNWAMCFCTQYQKQTPLLLWKHARTQFAVVLNTEGERGLLLWKCVLSDQMSCTGRKWILGWLAPRGTLY